MLSHSLMSHHCCHYHPHPFAPLSCFHHIAITILPHPFASLSCFHLPLPSLPLGWLLLFCVFSMMLSPICCHCLAVPILLLTTLLPLHHDDCHCHFHCSSIAVAFLSPILPKVDCCLFVSITLLAGYYMPLSICSNASIAPTPLPLPLPPVDCHCWLIANFSNFFFLL